MNDIICGLETKHLYQGALQELAATVAAGGETPEAAVNYIFQRLEDSRCSTRFFVDAYQRSIKETDEYREVNDKLRREIASLDSYLDEERENRYELEDKIEGLESDLDEIRSSFSQTRLGDITLVMALVEMMAHHDASTPFPLNIAKVIVAWHRGGMHVAVEAARKQMNLTLRQAIMLVQRMELKGLLS